MTKDLYDSMFTRIDQKFIYDHEQFVYPAAAAVSWGIVFGAKGIIIGVVLGSVDSIAIHYQIYNHPYLTYGSIGVAVLSPLKESPILKELIKKVESLNAIATPSKKLSVVTTNIENIEMKIIAQTNLGSFISYFKESLDFYKISISYVDLAGFIVGVALSTYNGLIPADIFYNLFSNVVVLYNLGTRNFYKEISDDKFLNPKQLFLFGIGLGLIDGAIVYFNYRKNFLISPVIRIFSIYESIVSIAWTVANYIYLNPIFNIGLIKKMAILIPNWQKVGLNFPIVPANIFNLVKAFFIFLLSYKTYMEIQNRFSYLPEKKFIPIKISEQLKSIYSRMIPEIEINKMVKYISCRKKT